MNWRSIRIGDFLQRVRIPVDIEDDQQYNLVTIRMHHKGVALRGTKPGKEIGTKRMYAVQPGHFILSGIDARHGAFGIVPAELDGAVVTNDFWYFEVDETQVDKELFLHLTSTSFFDDLCRIASDGTTNRVRLQADKFFNYEISLPAVEEQRELMTQLKHTNGVVASVLTETDYQLAHLAQLRQALLREAMQGQLLPQDPTDEPAAVLLQQLQAAKATTGKKGRGQAGALFTEEAEAVEGPFQIPASWVWCELGEVSAFYNGDRSSKYPSGADIVNEGIPFISTKNIVNSNINMDATQLNFITKEKFLSLSGGKLEDGDLVMCLRGSVGKTGLFRESEDFNTGFVNAQLVIIRPSGVTLGDFLLIILSNNFFQNQVVSKTSGSAQPQIAAANLKTALIPLPPLAEQHRIVAKLEQLLGHCDALEQRICESRRLAEKLLATALRETLAPPTGTTSPDVVELELVEAAEAPAPRVPRRGVQLALGSLLD